MLGSGIALLFVTLPAQAATTEVHIVKYAVDETTVLNETTVTYQWLEENLPVQGDGSTHYYFQGPVFEEQWEDTYNLDYAGGDWGTSEEKWDRVDRGLEYVQEEQCNCYPDKDLGACKGTDVRDLCELVGGMSPGDEVKIEASDGFFKKLPYSVIYNDAPALGPYVLTWYSMGAKEGGETSGYTGQDYTTGMRTMFFSDTSVNPWSEHITGIGNMANHIPEDYWHQYYGSGILYPSLGGHTVMHVSEIAIYSNMEPPVVSSIVVLPADVTLDIEDTQQFNATVYDQYSEKIPEIVVTWTSSDGSVGTINETGFFTAIAAGDAAITAGNGTVTRTAVVTVTSPASTPASTPSPTSTPTPTLVLTTITISPARATLNVGETQQFTAAAHDQDHRKILGVDFAWTSGNETVGTIDDAGFFTALCAGNTTIMAENGTVTGTAGVTISSPTPTPASTPTKTPSVDTTPTPSPAPAPAHSSSPPPSATSPASKATPYSSSFKSPGFEALFAIIGISVISCVLKRRKT